MLVNLKEILKIAEEEKSAIGMFNATGFDSLQAVISAAEELNQPVIIAHAEVHNVYNDISMVGPAMVAVAQNAKVPVCVHLDHGTSLDMIYKAFRLGFTSVMLDASALPYEENLRLTKQVTQMAHAMNVSVEAESAVTVMFLHIRLVLSVCPSACSHHSRIIRNLLSELAEKN